MMRYLDGSGWTISVDLLLEIGHGRGRLPVGLLPYPDKKECDG